MATALIVYGRPDSSAVARVLWTLAELNVPFERRDWGGAFGGGDDRAYRALQPAGKIPAVVLPDGRSLWESNAIIRYFAGVYDPGGVTPADPVARAQAEAWMDWSAAFQKAISDIRKAVKEDVPLAPARAAAAPVIAILEARLTGQAFVMGESFTTADLALGVWGHRFWRLKPEARPIAAPAIEAWLVRLRARPAYQAHVVAAVSVPKNA